MVKRERMCEIESQDGMRLVPDEVLLSILSLLSFKEATTTTRVARRWRYVHGWIRKLDLDGTESLCNLLRLFYTKDRLIKISYIEFKQRYNDLTCKYIRWVESVVANHKSSTIKEFRLLYPLDESHSDLIDSWLRFAVSRNVEKLELNLTPYDGYKVKRYTFPYNKNGFEFRFIRKLCTTWVNVSSEVVASFLRNCSLLEHLSVSYCQDLSSLEIINTFPSFKRLEIYRCFNLESVVIRDSNLVVLKIILKKDIQQIHVDVRNVPLLTEIWTSDTSLYLFSTVLPQIEILKLYIDHRFLGEDEVRSLGVDDMSNLKQLVVVDMSQNNNSSLLYLINFLKRSHGLERFVLEAPVYRDGSGASKENIPDLLLPIIIPSTKEMLQQYPCLKEIKLALNGYSSHQFELVTHFVETGVGLKNIVVDPHVLEHLVVYYLGCRWDDFIRQTQISERALEMARALQSILPSTITLTILN